MYHKENRYQYNKRYLKKMFKKQALFFFLNAQSFRHSFAVFVAMSKIEAGISMGQF